MPLPKVITVQGTFLKTDGTPESGTVEFHSDIFLMYSTGTTVVVPSVIRAALDSNGSVSVAVPATNDPEWSPANWNYKLVFRLTNNYSTSKVAVPYNAPGQLISFSQLIPASGGMVVSPGNSAHTHAATDIVSGIIAMARLPVGISHESVAYGDHVHNYDTVYSLLSHNHDDRYFTETEVTTALGLKAPINSPTFTGTVSGVSKSMVGLGNVDNTSDANKPISTATQTALDGKANTAHTHGVVDVTGLQAILDGKADDAHTHAVVDITGLQAILDGKADDTHTHAISDVTELQAELDSKQDAGDYATQDDVTALNDALDLKLDLNNPVISENTFTVKKADNSSGIRMRSTGGAVDFDKMNGDIVVSSFAGPEFSGAQTNLQRWRNDGTTFVGKTTFSTSAYGEEQMIDAGAGTALLGAKNGLGNIVFAGYKATPGAPTSGTWATKDLVIDSAGVWHICTAGGTPGTWT